jgi:hypothetical protein
MGAFDHVVLLLSFVYALALTHLLSRIGGLLNARERVRFSGLQALAMLNAIALVYSNWLALWDIHGISEWDLFSITSQFAFALVQYFICALAAPEVSDDGAVDLDAFYFRNRRPFYGMFLLLLASAFVANVTFLKTPNPSLFFKENATTLAFIPPILLSLLVSARWAQWAGSVGIFLIAVFFTTAFSRSLH